MVVTAATAAVVVAVGIVLFQATEIKTAQTNHAKTNFNKRMRMLSHMAYISVILDIYFHSKCN